MNTLKIYVSSTYKDLKKYRESVHTALKKARAVVIAMEEYVAQDKRPLQMCLDDVESCDVYVGIFAWRYGYIPGDKENNPDNLSITELEYRKAKEKGSKCLIFLLDDETEWPPKYIDGAIPSGKSSDNIGRLRTTLEENHTISFFNNSNTLANKVLTAVNKYQYKFDNRSVFLSLIAEEIKHLRSLVERYEDRNYTYLDRCHWEEALQTEKRNYVTHEEHYSILREFYEQLRNHDKDVLKDGISSDNISPVTKKF